MSDRLLGRKCGLEYRASPFAAAQRGNRRQPLRLHHKPRAQTQVFGFAFDSLVCARVLSCTPLNVGTASGRPRAGLRTDCGCPAAWSSRGGGAVRPRATSPRWAGWRGRWPLARHPLYVVGSPGTALVRRGWGHARSGRQAERLRPALHSEAGSGSPRQGRNVCPSGRRVTLSRTRVRVRP